MASRTTMPGTGSRIGPGRADGTVNATGEATALVAYQLWLVSGCPTGSDQEHWFRAEAILQSALRVVFEDLAGRSWPPHPDAACGPEVPAGRIWELWDGHWEVWEREWGSARWVWDDRPAG